MELQYINYPASKPFPPNLQIIFDPVNLLDISNYQNRDVIIEEAIELLGDDIAMVHMKDFVVQDGKLVW